MRGLIVTIGVIAAGFWFLSLDRPYATEQTWPESYATTSCTDWHSRMSAEQRQAAGADLLEQALSQNGSPVKPRLRQVTDWVEAIDRTCAADPDLTVEDAQVSLTA